MRVSSTPHTHAPDQKYPCLMRGLRTGVIALMYSQDEGVVLDPGNSAYAIGVYSWALRNTDFEPYRGSVTITTD